MRSSQALPIALCALLLINPVRAAAQARPGPARPGDRAAEAAPDRGPGPAEQVDRLLARLVRPDGPGTVVAVVQGGQVVYAKGYGLANLEYGVPNTPGTSYHVASVSKQFTAFAIAVLESRGLLSVEDDVRRYLPELPDFGVPITLRHLLNHTSGLRDQWTLWALAGGRLDDVITQDDLLALIQRQRELNFAPGSEHLYSNTGYLLLSEVVARVTGEPFATWMRREVFEPLGMKDTQVYDDHERIVPGRAYSYAARDTGGYRKSVLSYANRGATSLFTTASDLAHWLANFRTARVGGPAVLARLQERGVLTRGDTISYAFGLVLDEYRGLRRIQHSGADAGSRSMLMYFPALDAGVITLANVASFPGATATRIAEAFFEQHMTPRAPAAATPPPTTAPDAAHHVNEIVLDRYVGEYTASGGPRLRFVREQSSLSVAVDGEGRFALKAMSDTSFAVVPIPGASVVFHPEPDGRVLRVTAVRDGAIELRRIEPWKPDRAALAEYEGRYYSPELETFYAIALEDSTLVARHWRHGSIALESDTRDAFRSDSWFLSRVRFDRDPAGAVAGLRVSSGRVRELRFIRVESERQ